MDHQQFDCRQVVCLFYCYNHLEQLQHIRSAIEAFACGYHQSSMTVLSETLNLLYYWIILEALKLKVGIKFENHMIIIIIISIKQSYIGRSQWSFKN